MSDLLIYGMESGLCSGAYNMALDEFLLECLRERREQPGLIVRTYGWERSTLSLGVNQPEKDILKLLALYGDVDLVRRPTGGRAICHGEDISFSFITNDPGLVAKSLSDSYCYFTNFVRTAMEECGIVISTTACYQGEQDYTRSPVCFDTRIASDLNGPDGSKLSGSAQLRRSGAILQHGAAFVKRYGVDAPTFSAALFRAVSEFYSRSNLTAYELSPEETARFSTFEAGYSNESAGILAKKSTMTGSHLTPASC